MAAPQNDIINFGILCTQKKKTIGEKRKMSYEITDSIEITGLQNFGNYQKLNPVEIRINSNKIVNYLLSYKKYKYRLIIENLLFSSSITNKTKLVFELCDGLSNTKQSLINSRLYKTLGVIYLKEIRNWDIIKENSKRANVIFSNSEHESTASKDLGFGF